MGLPVGPHLQPVFDPAQETIGGAQFTGGTVHFHAATFCGSEVNFSRAGFTGSEVSFNGAGFTGGTVDFTRADFTGGTVSFSGAQWPVPPLLPDWDDPPPGVVLPLPD